MTVYFTSDLHFGHKNILKYNPEYRKFKDIHHMTESLVAYWNETVGEADTIYHLGDFSFFGTERTQEILDRLNGKKVFIWGNHDKFKDHDYLEIRIDGQRICMFHFPISSWNQMQRGSWMLHGHCHGNFQGEGKIIDVGWDAHGKFLTYEDIKRIMDKKEVSKVDHH